MTRWHRNSRNRRPFRFGSIGRVWDVAKSPATRGFDLGPPDAEAPHTWDTSGVARRFAMGDGLTYGWHRRGVPIPHVALVAVVLFAFGRITSTGGTISPAPSRGLPTPTLTAHHVADDAALLNRVEAAEREREQYKSLYQAREDELGAARASADDMAKQLEREKETRRSLADEVESGRRELAERTKQAAKDAAAGVSAVRADVSAGTNALRAVPPGREYAPHESIGVSGNEQTTTLDFQVLSWEPHAVLYRNFASVEECDHIKGLAASRLAPSGLALRQGEKPEETKDIRTSSGTFLSRKQDPAGVLLAVEKRIADATHVSYEHGEPFNVLRYTRGQKYDSHYDTFDPESYGPQTSQRIASFLLYLTDVEAGGETHFPLEGPNGLERLKNIDYKSCDGGLRVRPRAGDALLFWNVHPNRTFDKHALHGGCPVEKGEKWVATKWIRDKSFARG
jgi:prolyl 4-hydroxylase